MRDLKSYLHIRELIIRLWSGFIGQVLNNQVLCGCGYYGVFLSSCAKKHQWRSINLKYLQIYSIYVEMFEYSKFGLKVIMYVYFEE